MIFAPHILQKKVVTPLEKDEYGRSIPGTGGVSWENVCMCRCDNNSTKEFTSSNGSVYRPNFHIVCEKKVELMAGDIIRCMDADQERGSGKIYMVKSTNYFSYSEVWI